MSNPTQTPNAVAGTHVATINVRRSKYSLAVKETDTLELYFTPTGSTTSEPEYYTLIDLLQRDYTLEWESLKKNIRVSDRVRSLGENTEKRLTRWAQYAGHPTVKTMDKTFSHLASQINEVYKENPGAFQDLSRQAAALNWATNTPTFISSKSLWLLIHYGRITAAYSNNNGNRLTPLPEVLPNVHTISCMKNQCRASILPGDDWTIHKHFEAALNAAYEEALAILASNDPNILRLWHHAYRGNLGPDFKRLGALIGRKCLGTFYCLNGERLHVPFHIGKEITSLLQSYIQSLVNCVSSKNAAKGIEFVSKPTLRRELRTPDLWPAWPDNETRKQNIEKARGGRSNMNNEEIDTMNMKDDWAQSPELSFMANGIDSMSFPDGDFMDNNPYMFSYEEDISAVTGIDWNIPGHYQWAEPTPENTDMIITHKDFEFEEDIPMEERRGLGKCNKVWVPPLTKIEELEPELQKILEEQKPEDIKKVGLQRSQRGANGMKAMSISKTRQSVYANVKRIKEFFGVELSSTQQYRTKELSAWGWTRDNLKTGKEVGYLESPKTGIYILKFIDTDDYVQWRKQQDEYEAKLMADPKSLTKTLRGKAASEARKTITYSPFIGKDAKKKMTIAEKEMAKGRSQGVEVSMEDALKTANQKLKEPEPQEEVKKVRINIKKKTVKIKPPTPLEILTEKKEREGLTPQEEQRLQRLRVAEQRKQKELEQQNKGKGK